MKKTFLFLLIVFFFLPILSVVKAASFSFDKNAYPVAFSAIVKIQKSSNTANYDKIYIAGLFEDPASYKKENSALATVTFKELKDGTTNLTFDCNLSKITKREVNTSNILNCFSLTTASIVFVLESAGFYSNSSKNSSANFFYTNQNSPQNLLESGIFNYFLRFIIYSFVSNLFYYRWRG